MEVFGYDPAKDELPIKYLCGVMFPVSDLPKFLIPVAEIMPLTHTVRDPNLCDFLVAQFFYFLFGW